MNAVGRRIAAGKLRNHEIEHLRKNGCVRGIQQYAQGIARGNLQLAKRLGLDEEAIGILHDPRYQLLGVASGPQFNYCGTNSIPIDKSKPTGPHLVYSRAAVPERLHLPRDVDYGRTRIAALSCYVPDDWTPEDIFAQTNWGREPFIATVVTARHELDELKHILRDDIYYATGWLRTHAHPRVIYNEARLVMVLGPREWQFHKRRRMRSLRQYVCNWAKKKKLESYPQLLT